MDKTNNHSISELFRNSWEIYSSLLLNNYMYHKELSDAVHNTVITHFNKNVVDMLDLGCGDASQIGMLMQEMNLGLYHGCDLANAPLIMAKENVERFSNQSKLECKDMLECVSETKNHYDIVFSSFALHHLSTENKFEIFKKSHNVLKENGLLLLIDVTKKAGQKIHEYHNDSLFFARENWVELSANDLELIEEHVRAYDQPESIETYLKMGFDTGYTSAKVLAQHTWHTALMFHY
jgi:ubiquinone/menaquinone biosynthesis C-methylase UbiE